MILSNEAAAPRSFPRKRIAADLVVVGGGMAGVCCAITAARAGIQVALVQDRPVLGGNASSEVRLWILGATSHMGNNNRWAREGGVIDEILVENLWRNPEGNPILFDALILEFVSREKNVQLFLNTSVDQVFMQSAAKIGGVRGYCSQNQTIYEFEAPLFCDASGDGAVGFLSGAAFRMGAESRGEFGEKLAPPVQSMELLGHSLYFYSRDTGHVVKYTPPAFALPNLDSIPRYREITPSDSGCRLWWLEYGGMLDTIGQTEEIKWELWRVAYGVWDYIKNSGRFPEADTLTLEWMGTVPGKRESRRFEGPYMLRQQDIVEQSEFEDAVSCGGWAIDLHPPEGIFSAAPGCIQWHSKGVYQIPYRTMYSKNIENLFLAGRLISCSHIAFGSTRVMATCAHNAQAVGMAAALCAEQGIEPAAMSAPQHMDELQRRLLCAGQFIPGVRLTDTADLAQSADITASSALQLRQLSPCGTQPLDASLAMLLPLSAGSVPRFTLTVDVLQDAVLEAELWTASRIGNYTPDVQLECTKIALKSGSAQRVSLSLKSVLEQASYCFLTLRSNPDFLVHTSAELITGVLCLSQKGNRSVAKSPVQEPPADSGLDTFAFWLPERRPAARNLALEIDPPLCAFKPANVANGFSRPWGGTNAWVADAADPHPTLTLAWASPQHIKRIELVFDTDFDHAMESVLIHHPERELPFCVRDYTILDEEGRSLARIEGNHRTRNTIALEDPVVTSVLSIRIDRLHREPAAIFAVRCYAE